MSHPPSSPLLSLTNHEQAGPRLIASRRDFVYLNLAIVLHTLCAMGAGASQGRREQLRLTADAPGVVLSLLPHEHLSLSFGISLEHQQRMGAAIALGLYSYIAIKLNIKDGQVGRLQLHLPQQHVKHVTQLPGPQPASPTFPSSSQQPSSSTAPTILPPTTQFDASTRLTISNGAFATNKELVLYLLSVDCDSFRPASYPLTVTNSAVRTVATLSAHCHVDNPVALNTALHALQLDHHSLAWQLHAAQQQIQQLQLSLHSSHTQLHERDRQAVAAKEQSDKRRAQVVNRLFSSNDSFTLRSHFAQWRLQARRQHSLRGDLLQSALTSCHQRCLATVWVRWASAVSSQEADRWKARLNEQKHKRARTLIAHHFVKSTTTVFHAWREYVRHTRHRKRAVLEAMLGKKELARQWKVWKHWTGKVLRKRTHVTQQQLAEHREERDRERERHREERERHEKEREERTKELEEKVLSASQIEAVAAARAAELVHKRVNAVVGRMLQGSLRTSFMAWRACARRTRQARVDAVSLLLGKRTHTSVAHAFRTWKAEARRSRQSKLDEEAAEEERVAVKADRRQAVQCLRQWRRWYRQRLQHREEAQTLIERLVASQQLQGAWRVWRQRCNELREEEKQDDYGYVTTMAASSSRQPLPVVSMSRAQPLSSSSRSSPLPTSFLAHAPSASSASSRPSVLPVSSSAYRQLQSDHSSLLELYRRLFLLLQSLRSDVNRQWEAEAARLLQHVTCRCEQCARRKASLAKGGTQLAWLRRYDQQIEGFRYAA